MTTTKWGRAACAAALVLGPVVLASSCGLAGVPDVDAATPLGGGGDASEPIPSVDAFVPHERTLDLLLMIDDSNSMTEEQASVAFEIPRVLNILASGDRDGDGVRDFEPPTSIHVGIVDSDMGLGDVTGIATCDPGFGDDGLMTMRARHPEADCATDYRAAYGASFFAFAPSSTTSSVQFAIDVSCVSTLGTDGCGFEAELESPLKALSLTPTASGDSPVAWTHAGYRPPRFYGGTFGHGDDPDTNGAFLRPGSVLAIVTVNDEDDCSTPNPQIFSPDNPIYNVVDLNLRCHRWQSELYPIERYVDGFAGLRADPSRLVFASITGVPNEVSGRDAATILAHPQMTEQIDPRQPSRLLPACVSPDGRGVAYPAVRMTHVAEGLAALGAHTTVQSICNAQFSSAFDAVIDSVVAAF